MIVVRTADRVFRNLMGIVLAQVLRGRLPSIERKNILRHVWMMYRELEKDLDSEPTLGAGAMVRLAAATVSIYKALVLTGLSEADAKRITSEITWTVYRKLAWLPWKITRMAARDNLFRVKVAMDLFMRFPYGPPGYCMEYVPSERDTVAIDVTRCPAADYFARQGMPERCALSFCLLRVSHEHYFLFQVIRH